MCFENLDDFSSVNTVCLGGTRQVNNPSLALDKKDSNGILERCKELCPSLEVVRPFLCWAIFLVLQADF